MDGGAWRATVHGVAKSWTQPSDFPFTVFHKEHRVQLWRNALWKQDDEMNRTIPSTMQPST